MNELRTPIQSARLMELDPRERSLFAYGCAYRVAPIYRNGLADPEPFDAGLELLRLYVGGLDVAAGKARELVAKMTEELDALADDEAPGASVQAGVAVASALETIYLDSVKGAIAASSFALDAVRLVAPDEANDEKESQAHLLALLSSDEAVDLQWLDSRPEPRWMTAVSPGGPLLG